MTPAASERNMGPSREPGPMFLAAGALVACGLTPIPVRGKRPAVAWKAMQGRRLIDHDWDDADRYLRAWWDRPEPYNLGVLTGGEVYVSETRTSRLVVVDVDDQEARELVERTCGWPRTPTVRTSHGWHLWFTYDRLVGNRAHVADVGLDVRGRGGYVVVPPSVHPSGHVYSWEVGISWHEDDRIGMWPPAPMPLELAEFLWPHRPAVNGRGALAPIVTDRYVEVALEREVASVASASEGSRNDTLNRAAYALARFVRDGRIEVSAYVSELSAAGMSAGLPEPEVRRTLASALKGRT